MDLKAFVPTWAKSLRKYIKGAKQLLPVYSYWFKRDVKSSMLFRNEKSDMANLLIMGHVLEKGITMPNRRLGFGYERVRELITFLKEVISLYSANHTEVQAALGDLEQYDRLHKDNDFALPKDIQQGIDDLKCFKSEDTSLCFKTTVADYFGSVSDFAEFAHQRHSVRWYSDVPVPEETIIKSIKLAQTAPSACNRQSTKVYILSSKEAKEVAIGIQNGNRGFGHLADKMLLITANMKCWGPEIRTSAFLDAGIFIMNLLYALHYNKVCACTLNAHMNKKKRKQLQQAIGYTDSEVPVAFISIGNPPQEFMIAGSQRVEVGQMFTIV